MNLVLRLIAGVPAIAFVVLGVAWWLAPDFAAAQLGMELQSGAGLSSQIGDLGSFFITAGAMVLVGLVSQNRLWFYPAVVLLGTAVCGRIIAWLGHGATLTVDFIAVEVTVIAVLLFVASRMPKENLSR